MILRQWAFVLVPAVLDDEGGGLKMGQALTKCINPDAASDDGGGAIDPALLKPTGLYENQAAHFRKSQVKKHILEGRIAPFYPYKEEDPEMEVRLEKVQQGIDSRPHADVQAPSLRHMAYNSGIGDIHLLVYWCT